jgi:hypothetical protein
MALDGPNQNSILQLSYEFAPKWRLEMLHTLFKFGGFNDFDYQIGFARSIGTRDLAVYWSRKEHKFLFEFGVARF